MIKFDFNSPRNLRNALHTGRSAKWTSQLRKFTDADVVHVRIALRPVQAEDEVRWAEDGCVVSWIDISMSLRNGMVQWPDDPPLLVERISDTGRGDDYTLSVMTMGSHTGTHVDAPLHCLRGGMGIDRMPLDVGIGRARVFEIRGVEPVSLRQLEAQWSHRSERVLFKTRNSSFIRGNDHFVPDFVSLSQEVARFLVDKGVKLVGIDYLSAGGYNREGAEVHRILLGAGVWILEGLDLSRIPPGEYDMICLPLRLFDGDGAPARAVLRPL